MRRGPKRRCSLDKRASLLASSSRLIRTIRASAGGVGADYCNRCRTRACGSALHVLLPLVQLDSERRLDRAAADRWFRRGAAVSTCAPGPRPQRVAGNARTQASARSAHQKRRGRRCGGSRLPLTESAHPTRRGDPVRRSGLSERWPGPGARTEPDQAAGDDPRASSSSRRIARVLSSPWR
jgi:hypothetical protein